MFVCLFKTNYPTVVTRAKFGYTQKTLRKKKLPFYLMSYLSNDKFVKFHREPALNKNTSITPVQEYFKICIDKSLRKHSILQRSRKYN